MKFPEIKEVISLPDTRGREHVNNKLASKKWILLDVKIVERQRWRSEQRDMTEKSYLEKDYETIYVIGRIK